MGPQAQVQRAVLLRHHGGWRLPRDPLALPGYKRREERGEGAGQLRVHIVGSLVLSLSLLASPLLALLPLPFSPSLLVSWVPTAHMHHRYGVCEGFQLARRLNSCRRSA